MKKLRDLLEKPWFSMTFAVCCGVILYLFLSNLAHIFGGLGWIYQLTTPVVIGIIMAYMMNPMAVWFENGLLQSVVRDRTRHSLSVFFTVLILLAALVLLILAVIPSLVRSLAALAGGFDSYREAAAVYINDLSRWASDLGIDISELISAFNNTLNKVAENMPAYLNRVLEASHNMGAFLVNLVIGFILAVYILMSKQSMLDTINRLRHALMSEEAYRQHNAFFKRCHTILISYIGYSLLDAMIVGTTNAVFMSLFRMEFTPLISLLVGTTNLLPTFGPMIGAALGAFILVLVNPFHALLFLIFTLVLQTIDGYVIKPKLFGGMLGVPSVVILISIVLGGQLMGAAGILFAIPFAAIFTFVYNEAFLPWLEARKDKKEVPAEAGASGPAEPAEAPSDQK